MAVLIASLVKTDVAHIFFLFMFVSFLLLPKRQGLLTTALVVMSSLFLLVKYVLTLMKPLKNDSQDTEDEFQSWMTLLRALGIASNSYEPSADYKWYEYPVKILQWSFLATAMLLRTYHQLFGDIDVSD